MWLALVTGASGADTGSWREIRAIRSELPIVLQAYVDALDPHAGYAAIDDVIASGDRASARWHAGRLSGSEALERIYGRWWDVSLARHSSSNDPSSEFPVVGGTGFRTVADGYDTNLRADFTNPSPSARIRLGARRPTYTESWANAPGGNAYFFFSLSLVAERPLQFASSSLDVWFPFDLDPSYRYSLTLANAEPVVGPVPGTLAKNTLHFVLPAFAVVPDREVLGEIGGDPAAR